MKSNAPFYLICVLFALFGAAVVFFTVSNKQEAVKQCEEVRDSMLVETPPPTVDEIINLRNLWNESIRIDSIYRFIPENVLRDILEEHGTLLDNFDVVDIYEKNKDKYEYFQRGWKKHTAIKESTDSIRNDTTYKHRTR